VDGDDREIGRKDGQLTFEIEPDLRQPQQVGSGYNSITKEFRNPCIINPNLYPAVPGTGAGGLEKVTTTSSMATSLGISADAKGSYGLFSGSASAKFSRSARTTDQSISLLYKMRSHKDTIGLNKAPPITLRSGIVPGGAAWLETCGDSYVKDIVRGSEIFILAKMDFATAHEKEAFEGSVSASYGSNSLSAQWSKARESFKGRAAIRMEAFQRGGEVERLGNAFSGTTSGAQSLAVVDCSFDNLAPCADFLSGAIAYATGTGVNHFPANAARRPTHLSYTMERWSDLPNLTASQPALPKPVSDARKALFARLEHELAIRDRIDAVGNLGAPKSFRDRVAVMSGQSTNNAEVLQNAAAACFDQLSAPPTTTQVNACVNATTLAGLKGAGYVELSLSQLELPLKAIPAYGRADRLDDVTVGTGLYGNWTAWKMCPKGTFASGYRMRVETPQGKGDDTALNGIWFDCQKWERTKLNELLVDRGLYGTEHGYARCKNGPMNGMNLRFEKSQGSGDDAGATDIEASCVSGEQIHAPGGIEKWGDLLGMKHCPAGTAVCGARVRTESSRGKGDDTTLNGLELSCCLY
jgi:hypothetical protein